MENLRKKLEERINGQIDLTDSTLKDEIVESLFIYHEELMFQNDELNEANKRLIALEKAEKSIFNMAPCCQFIIDDKLMIKKANGLALNTFNLEIGDDFRKHIFESEQDDFYFFINNIEKGGDVQRLKIKMDTSLGVLEMILTARVIELMDKPHIFIALVEVF